MAKRSNGATEINGFISVDEGKPSKATKTSVRKLGVNSQSKTDRNEILKDSKKPLVSKKTVPARIDTGRVKTSKNPNDMEKKENEQKKGLASRQTVKNTTQLGVRKNVATTNLQKRESSLLSTNKSSTPVRKTTVATNSKAAALKKTSEIKDITEVKKPVIRAMPDVSPYTNYSKALGKSGLSYTVNVGQPKKLTTSRTGKKDVPPKPTSKSKKEEPKTKKNSSLSRQGTFVKEDENTSLLESKSYDYSEQFEEYESDFENSEREKDASLSNAEVKEIKESSNEANNLQTSQIYSRGIHQSNIDQKVKTLEITRSKESVAETFSRRNDLSSLSTSKIEGSQYYYEESKLVSVDSIQQSLNEPTFESLVDSSEVSLQQTSSPGREDDLEKTGNEENYDYEDDFEDYESDFEEDTESGFTTSEDEPSVGTESLSEHDRIKEVPKKQTYVEEEKKLDSGNYDLTTKMIKPDILKTRQLQEIKEAISRENTVYIERNAPSEQSLYNKDDYKQIKVNIYNFKAAAEKNEPQEVRKSAHKRSKLLLSMIPLHTMSFNLLEISPTPYDVFIKLYGKLNFNQACTQTSDDASSEECQTEDIVSENKWTQWPLEYHKWNNDGDDLAVYLEDRKGVGGDKHTEHISWISKCTYNARHLSDFVLSAGQMILIQLEEEAVMMDSNAKLYKNKHDEGFSAGYITISGNNTTFLNEREITNFIFSPHNPNIVLLCHKASEEAGSTFIHQYYGRCIITLWNVLEPSLPQKLLVASCQISSICFDSSYDYLIYAGLTDGSICIWDLSERTDVHQQYSMTDIPTVLRSPTYCSFINLNDSLEERHLSSVIDVKSIGYGKHSTSANKKSLLPPTQLLSLSDDGKVIVWTVTQYPKTEALPAQPFDDIGIAPWGRIKLVCTSVLDPYIQLPSDTAWIQFTCMALTIAESPSLLLGTNLGCVVHCLVTGIKPKIPLFGEIDESVCITCIEFCPHRFPLFLVGTDDGTIRLQRLDKSETILTFICHTEIIGDQITSIKWSNLKPGLFMVMDKDSNIHVWDLCKGDIFPQFTVPHKKKRACNMDISRDIQFPYLGIIINGPAVEIHKFKEDFIPRAFSTDKNDLKFFELYISKIC